MTQQAFEQAYPIILKSFEYGGAFYNIALAPEYYRAEDGLDFTGSYECILISSEWGTKTFQMEPDAAGGWEPLSDILVPGIVQIIAGFIKESRGYN